MTTFNDLGLAAPLLQVITNAGYEQPTPIQAQAIPAVLTGKDLLGIAQTGTGKTAAFALPIIQRLAANRIPAQRRSCHVLVLSPTRELATQIADTFRMFGKPYGLSTTVVFGGVSHGPQIQALSRGVDILVATPGRLLDHMAERNISLAGTSVLVLDEGDQMLDLGFFPSIRKVVALLPAKRQSLFFSATLPAEIEKLTRDVLRDPVKVAVAPAATTAELVSQRIIHIDATRKRSLLVELLSGKELSRTLIFTRTKRGADRVAKHLEVAGIGSAAIHGNKSQAQREKALDAFKRGKIGVLVATDIAARGIDIDAVSHVINFELPEVPETYVHRIGRTARAGASGTAISLCDNAERPLLRDIERLIRQALPAEDRRHDKTLEVSQAAPARTGRRDQGRRSDEPRGNGHARGNRNGHAARGDGHAARGDGPRHGDDRRRDDTRRDDRNGAARPAANGARDDRRYDDRRRDDRPAAPRAAPNGARTDRRDDRRRDDRNGAAQPARPRSRDGAKREGERPAVWNNQGGAGRQDRSGGARKHKY